jgi:hypothetical protein
VQVLAAPRNELLHERHAEALSHAALDLPLDEHGVHGAADIMRGKKADQPGRAQLQIDLHLGQMRAEPIDGIGVALPVRIQGRGRRIEGGFRGEHIAARIQGQRFQPQHALVIALAHGDAALLEG